MHFLILTGGFLAALLQTPQAPQTLPQDLASLEGTVVRAGTAIPVARARVILNSEPNARTSTTLVSDELGRFSFKDLPPGRYQLLASRDGYVNAAYGRRTPNGAPSVITLAPMQALRNVALEMTPTSSISGRIRDRSGKPLGNVEVTANTYSYREGRRNLSPVQRTRTNDLGEFRLYYLKPGRYVLSAIPAAGPVLTQGTSNDLRVTALPGNPIIGPEGAGDGGSLVANARELAAIGLLPSTITGTAYIPVYFPGVMDSATAMPIDVEAGRDFTAADFVVGEARAARIRGKVDGGAGGLAGGASVMLLDRIGAGGFPPRVNGVVAPDGTFEFAAVPPGSYDVVAMIGKLPPGMAFGASGTPGGASINRGPIRSGVTLPPIRDPLAPVTDVRLVARVAVQVEGKDVENVILTPQVGYTVNGRVTIEERSAEDSRPFLEGMIVQLQPDPELFEMAAMPALLRPDGTFTAVGTPPGKYRVWLMSAANLPATGYIKSVRLGIVDVINPRLVIDAEPKGLLEVGISLNPGTLTATVVDARQGSARGVTVILVPDAPRRQHFELYVRATSDDSGVARFANVPAGDYTAYAWEDVDLGAWWDPEFLQKYQGRGSAIHIDDGGKHTAFFDVIPYR